SCTRRRGRRRRRRRRSPGSGGPKGARSSWRRGPGSRSSSTSVVVFGAVVGAEADLHAERISVLRMIDLETIDRHGVGAVLERHEEVEDRAHRDLLEIDAHAPPRVVAERLARLVDDLLEREALFPRLLLDEGAEGRRLLVVAG